MAGIKKRSQRFLLLQQKILEEEGTERSGRLGQLKNISSEKLDGSKNEEKFMNV